VAGARREPIVRPWIHFLAAAMAYVDRKKAANDGKKSLVGCCLRCLSPSGAYLGLIFAAVRRFCARKLPA
jgi:hypothetical protein